jgi:hypothetical protein
VSVVGSEEPLSDVSSLDPASYGVIVRDDGGRQGMLLPLLDGIDDVATQLRLAREKAGISESAPLTLSRFSIDKWSDATASR